MPQEWAALGPWGSGAVAMGHSSRSVTQNGGRRGRTSRARANQSPGVGCFTLCRPRRRVFSSTPIDGFARRDSGSQNGSRFWPSFGPKSVPKGGPEVARNWPPIWSCYLAFGPVWAKTAQSGQKGQNGPNWPKWARAAQMSPAGPRARRAGPRVRRAGPRDHGADPRVHQGGPRIAKRRPRITKWDPRITKWCPRVAKRSPRTPSGAQ